MPKVANAVPATAPSVAITRGFGQQLAGDGATAGAYGEADRELAPPRDGAQQRHDRDVHAGDEQHRAGGGEQDRQAELQVPELAGAQRFDAERPLAGGVVGGLRLLQIAGDAGEVVAGLIQGHAGGEPRDGEQARGRRDRTARAAAGRAPATPPCRARGRRSRAA